MDARALVRPPPLPPPCPRLVVLEARTGSLGDVRTLHGFPLPLSLSLTPSLPQRRVAPKDGGRQCGLIKGGDGGQTGGVKEVSRWEVGLLSSAESRNPCVLRAVAHFTCSLFSKLHNKPTHCASNCT